MTAVGPDADVPAGTTADASRRTWLAAERTWLAWWRTGLGAAAVGIAIGRFVPGITHGARWPFRVVGIGYALLAIAALTVGAIRQQRTGAALRRGSYEALSSPLVMWLTAAAVLLSGATIALIAVRL